MQTLPKSPNTPEEGKDDSVNVPSPIKAVVIVTLFVVFGLPLFDRMVISKPLAHSMSRLNNPSDYDDEESMKFESGYYPKSSLPEVAWLMTYPNSGTTYTLKLIQQYTNTTTATNYGNEQGTKETTIPVHKDLENGPFFRYPSWRSPPRYILTKTHCAGTSIDPSPTDYVETVRSFETACRSGNRILNDTKISPVMYEESVPKRAVHLFRNPFDNIVARLHLEQKRWNRTENDKNLAVFNASKVGFHAWCAFQDSRAFRKERSSRFFDMEVWELAKGLPCHAEFMRYAWWHDLAIETARRKKFPVHYLFYENYTENWVDTVHQLFGFLYLSPAEGASPLEFITGKHYVDYYNQEHVRLAGELVSKLVSPESWALLEHYFQNDSM